ncbi:MAG: hemerythrin domain-containing protein [Rhodanobacteraceae bacterium]
MDAIKLLKAGHYQIRDLLEDLCDADIDAAQVRSDLLEQVSEALEAHYRIENEILYPAFADVAERDDDIRLVQEAVEEKRIVADLLLPDLLEAGIGSEQFGGRAKVLCQLVEHHIREEEAELFPRIKKLLTAPERNALGERLLKRKQELQEGVTS